MLRLRQDAQRGGPGRGVRVRPAVSGPLRPRPAPRSQGPARAGRRARGGGGGGVAARACPPPPLLAKIRSFGAALVLVAGHIGDCGRAARAYAAETGAVDVSTLREPYRIEGKKTLGLELAEQLGWTLPDAIVYPTGGGTGLIGMWKAFREPTPPPRARPPPPPLDRLPAPP